jgi:antitoxin component YwqK of YwqJK toxin-antitoxin module
MNYNGNLYINKESSTVNIDASKYSELSCTLTFWITGIFVNDKINIKTQKNGLLTESYPNGNRKIEYTFSDGIKNGVQKKWYNNGQLEILYYYNDGKLEGLQKKWYQSGTLKGEWNYREDKLNGIIKEWYPNKQIKFIKEYNNGELVEIIENNDLDGNPY